ncbi:hypothetical protein JMJ56_09285 [Belnapia sp. T18]|uniref:Uncharacterized protein n=1 Tax=Belnapia arida TaxID=2804533 RepID=A0ABS1U0I2_9PROT|nr:hypothetical protein [Belnapia arida]MBL6078197.1 hypothetical protein [Belnapia arida]
MNAAIPFLWAGGLFGIAFGAVGLVYYFVAFIRIVWQRHLAASCSSGRPQLND